VKALRRSGSYQKGDERIFGDGDFVMIGTVSRVGISGLFVGNTAERILSNINASVLTVKPEGCKTPVK
jgi:nucleotide-binding universal stress UspA family protein